ncbi:olfactory receptor 5AR1-like [Hyperolius riggenbachi]|uniref:olfactory receptor 5AR1-like n=1 Tax=Hyperolius riggenbachi TaxID=752182 RepID=UPI0035A3122A
MDITNRSQITLFEFSGLTDDKALIPFLFVFFLLVYIVTVVGNLAIMIMTNISSSLQTQMYFFLNYLSLVDLVYSSIITPKMLSDLISVKKSISLVGCALQFFFFASIASTEVFILACMALDRYAAICRPLHYALIMTKNNCLCMVLLSFFIGFLQAVVPTGCMFTLTFCVSNHIEHYYCDVPPLLKLTCSDPLLCNILLNIVVCLCTVSSMMTILVSYCLIISSIIRIKSSKGRRKAFSTCSSHLTCVTILYATVLSNYLHPSSDTFNKYDKSASLFYSVINPMLNPIIYSLRNQDVKKAFLEMIQKRQN